MYFPCCFFSMFQVFIKAFSFVFKAIILHTDDSICIPTTHQMQ